MSRSSEAKQVVNTISRHLEPILEACLEHQGRLFIGDEATERAAESLIARRMAYRLGDDDDIIISRVLGDFIHQVTQSQRRRVSSGEVHDQWEQLDHEVENYSLVRIKNGSQADIDHYRRLSEDAAYSFIDTMRVVVERFSEYISNDFRSISNLDIKIRETERALEQAQKTNALFETINFERLYEMAGGDPFLIDLLTRKLAREVKRMSRDTADALHHMKRNLASLRKESAELERQNSLIDGIITHYDQNPSFEPILEIDKDTPDCFKMVGGMELAAYPDLESRGHQEALTALAKNSVSKLVRDDGSHEDESRRKELNKTVDVEDHDNQTEVFEEEPEERVVREFFQILPEALAMRDNVSAMWFHQHLDDPYESGLWLLAIMQHYFSLPDVEKADLSLEYVTTELEDHNGNHVLQDLKFSLSAQ